MSAACQKGVAVRAKRKILLLYEFVRRRKIKIPELLNDFPSGGVKRGICIRIIFTKLRQDKILIGGMTANANRLQKKRTPQFQKYVPAVPDGLPC